MSTQVQGLALNAATQIPTFHAITSSTDATPIVVTTTTAHGITTGDSFLIDGHHVNVHAIGIWTAGVVTSNTVELVGSTATSAGAGGATGILQSLVFGATYPVPNDLTDDMDAASVGVPFEAIADKLALTWLELYGQNGSVRRTPLDTGLTNASTGQFISTLAKAWQIPATFAGGAATLTVLPGLFSGIELELFRAPSPDSNQVTLTCAGGNSYILAGSTAGWIWLKWNGSNWLSTGNGTGWTGTHALV